MLETLLNWILDRNNQILQTCLSAIIISIIAFALKRALIPRAKSIEGKHKIRRSVSWAGFTLFAATLLFIWARQVGSLGVFLGVIGAGLALSLQELLLCIAAWAMIIAKKPFDVGDRIEINNKIGDVIDISLLQFSVLEVGNWVEADQSTGRILTIPNSEVIRHGTFNYTKGFPFIWNEMTVTVTYESDWRKAKRIILDQAQEEAEKIEKEVHRRIELMQRQYAIHYERLQPIVYTSIVDSGVSLTLRYLTPVRKRRVTAHTISEAIIEAFLADSTIDFSYPTTRFFHNYIEGKIHPPGISHVQTGQKCCKE